MICSLRIKNLATIEDLELSFDDGFSILTGETGAGKSIIIDGIKLLLGEKASPESVRTGKEEASVEAIFRFQTEKEAPPAKVPAEEEEIFIQRQIPLEGPGKTYANGILVPLKKLKETSHGLADIYGQNDHVFLLQLESHLEYLDQYLEASSLREEVAFRMRDLKDLFRQKRELEEKQRERVERLDFLSYQIQEIERAGLKPGEWEDLTAERELLKNAEKINFLVEKALDISYLQEESISPMLSKLQTVIAELSRYEAKLEAMNDSLLQSAIAVKELADFLIKFKERQASAPERLEAVEERLSQIERLKRKYGPDVSSILTFFEKIKKERRDLENSAEKLTGLDNQIAATFAAYKKSADRLSRIRREGAKELERRIEEEIGLLGMKKARFHIKIESSLPGPDDIDRLKEAGIDEVEFLISPNPGEELKPLRKIASGGELSRIMLALKAIGKEKGASKTLIFDEIDSGIGGKTAEFIAQKLRKLARQHQIICITHLPQIASYASHHYRIDKKVEKDRTFTTVKKLKFEERVSEISRLLSGTCITEASLQNAREMLLRNSGSIESRK